MPLSKSSGKKAFSSNVSAEMHAGRPQKQALAIAYSVQREAKRKGMASGGAVRLNEERQMMAPKENNGHLPPARTDKPAYADKDTTGAVPMRHRNRLGHGGPDLQSNPQGVGRPSRESKIANGGNW